KKNEKAVKVYSLEKVNRPFLRKGLLPKKDNEVVTEEMYMEKEHLHIGDTIQLKTVNGMKEVTISGIVDSPLYMNNTQRGANTLGDGTTSAFFYVMPTIAKMLALPPMPSQSPTMYTELYVTVEGAKKKNTFEDNYTKTVKKVQNRIKKVNQQWILLDRDKNAWIVTYGEDADTIGAIGKTFPLIFFLVATMVCLTSMTRMVEEQRVQIGTLKALGYGTWAIVSHYLLYPLLASIGGSIIGVMNGCKLFPTVIFHDYQSMYHIPNLVTGYYLNLILSSSLVAILCTTIAAVLACIKELMAVPSTLMRPKAPKSGKRILLERMTFIWNQLSFTGKVT